MNIPLNELSQILTQIRWIRSEIKSIDQNSKALIRELQKELSPPYYWSEAYELPLMEHMSLFFNLAGLTGFWQEIGEKENPRQALIDSFDGLEIDTKSIPETFKHPKWIIGTWFALVKSIQSLSIYGYSLNALLAQFKADNQDEHIFKAIRIDHSIISNPTVADRITFAEISNDKKFFHQLSNAIKERPKKHTARYEELRFMLAILEEANSLDQLSIEDLYQLFCIDLGLYPSNGADPARNLHRFVLRWKEDRATRKRDFMSSS